MNEGQKIDIWLLAVTLILAGVGLVMVYSSSMYLSMDKIGSASYYFKRQAMFVVIGFILMMIMTRVNYRGFALIAPWLLGIGIATLVALLAYNKIMGYDVNRWIRIGVRFQPSELMKLILVIFLAAAIAEKGERVRQFKSGFLPLLGIVVLVFGLVFLQPDLGISGMLLIVGLYLLFIGRANIMHMIAVGLPALVSVVLCVWQVPYMRRRWEEFMSPEMAYQIKQSIIGIGSGGFFGVGLGNSVQKYYFLPERHTDFVFSIMGEELGFIGTAVLLLLTLCYAIRGMKIARQAPDMFGFLVASGFAAMFAMQVFINIGVAVRLLPTTGMTLPFVSYGGSSLMVSFIATGIMLNISRQGNYELKLSREFGKRSYRKAWQ